MALEMDNIFLNNESNAADEFFSTNSLGSTQIIIKNSDQTQTTGTLKNDTELKINLSEPNAQYLFELNLIIYNQSYTDKLEIKIVLPTGSTGGFGYNWIDEESDLLTGKGGIVNTTYTLGYNSMMDDKSLSVVLNGAISLGSTTGDFQFQWAPDSSATGITIQAGSYIKLTKLLV